MQDAKKPNAAVVAIIIVVLIGAVAAGTIYIMNSRQMADNSNSASDLPATSNQATDQPAAEKSYKSGTYTASGSYLSPGGEESVDVQVTLDGDIITAATVTPHAAAGTSVQYQTEFVNNFKSLVVGKDIDEVKLSRVAGSSLTSGGFNKALDKIKTDATA